MKKRTKFLITTFIFLYSCSTTTMASLPLEKREAIQTTLFKDSYMNVFIAVVEVFHDEGYSIDQADEWLGLITTTWKEERVGLFFRKDIRRRMNARLEKVDINATQVKLKYFVQIKGESDWQSAEDEMRIREAKNFYKKFFRFVKRKLKKYRWIK